MLRGQELVAGGQFEFIGRARVAGEPQHIDAQGAPGNGAAGLDGPGFIDAAARAFAGAERARGVPFIFADALPEVDERVLVLLLSGEAVEVEKALHDVEAFPAGAVARQLVIGDALRAEREPVAGILHVLFDAVHHRLVARVAVAGIEVGQHIEHGEIALGRARLDGPAVLLVDVADERRGAFNGVEGRFAAGVVVPHQQAEHDVIVSPKVPMAEQLFVLAERAEIPVLRLGIDKGGDEIAQEWVDPRVTGHAPRLHRANEVFSRELARPGHNLRVGPVAVAAAEHVEQARVLAGRAQQPVFDVCLQALADNAFETPVCGGYGFHLGGFLFRRGLREPRRQDAGSQRKTHTRSPVDSPPNGGYHRTHRTKHQTIPQEA